MKALILISAKTRKRAIEFRIMTDEMDFRSIQSDFMART